MDKLKTKPFDVAGHLRTPKERARYLEVMIEETGGDPRWILKALDTIARSEGMTQVAKKSGLSRESLYKALSGNRNPEFGTIFKVMEALGLQFRVTPMPPEKPHLLSAPPSPRTTRTKRAATPPKKPLVKRTSLKTPRAKSRAVAKTTRAAKATRTP